MHDEDNYTHLFHPCNPDGYIGCYKDSEIFSDLSGTYKTLPNDSLLVTCRTECKTYLYFGFRYSSRNIECHCGNDFGFYGSAPEEECPTCARGSHGERCGSLVSTSVYRVEPFRATFVGCFMDGHYQRDLDQSVTGNHTPITCANACAKYKYFGLQNGWECYCGNSYGRYGNVKLMITCMMPCLMDSKLLCGGNLTNAVFEIL